MTSVATADSVARSRDSAACEIYTMTEVTIGGLSGTLARPQGLMVGRYRWATGELMAVGRNTTLGHLAAADMARMVKPASGEHPRPEVLPPGWTSSIHGSRESIRYTRVILEVVLEVRVDIATDRYPWRHPVRYERLRPDLTVTRSDISPMIRQWSGQRDPTTPRPSEAWNATRVWLSQRSGCPRSPRTSR
jgi:hypothetical protein